MHCFKFSLIARPILKMLIDCDPFDLVWFLGTGDRPFATNSAHSCEKMYSTVIFTVRTLNY